MSALPTRENMNHLFTMLFGDETACQPAKAPVPLDPGTVIGIYTDVSGAVRRAVACDLSFASSAGAALSLIPLATVNDAVKSGTLPDNILANLHEVMNISVNLFAESYKERLEFSNLVRFEGLADDAKASLQTGTKVNFDVKFAQYPTGRVSLIAAL